MQSNVAKLVLRLLSNDKTEFCIAACYKLMEQTKNDPKLISTIITGEESWVYGYEPETTQQSS
jgi:hypothetical protein